MDNAATLRTDLRPYDRRGNVGLTHVEGHAAALIREKVRELARQVHAVLVITREPCPGDDGCEVRLPELLPLGTTLRVYVRDEHGNVRSHKVYVGTGQGVRL